MDSEPTMKVLICAPIKSGTKYIYRALNDVGIEIGHEKPKKDGLSGYSFVMQDPDKYEIIVQQTRDPLKSISSAAKYRSFWCEICEPHLGLHSDYPQLCKLCKEHGISQTDGCGMRPKENYVCPTKVLRTMKYWYCMCRDAEKMSSWRYKVEDYYNDTETRKTLHDMLGVKKNKPVFEWAPNNPNYTYLDWDYLEGIDAKLTEMIRDKAKLYGY